MVAPLFSSIDHSGYDETLFEAIAVALIEQGYAIKPDALPIALADRLQQQALALSAQEFQTAGVGRETEHTLNRFVRKDRICWITGESETGNAWLQWVNRLQTYLNRRLFLGLFSNESHYAHYRPGDFYKKHVDAFKGEANRVLSMVVYLNSEWQLQEGGELVLYADHCDEPIKVLPSLGTIAVFLSEEMPHEVLPATRDRYSIATWFRVNTSTASKVDPPR